MWNITNKIKNGNKVVYEVTSDSGETQQLSKDEIIIEIQNKRIANARIQVYKGQTIIRVKGKVPNKKQTEVKTDDRKAILALDLFKNIAKAFGVRVIEEALALGFDKYELDEEISFSDKKKITELSYEMAVDIKVIADNQNNKLLNLYKKAAEK